LDQFCGAGTTAVEAKLLGRRCIARDINPAAIALAHQNLNFEMTEQDTLEDTASSQRSYEPLLETGDARRLVGIDDGSVDLICTHPPYADIIHYTEGHPEDISFHGVDTFIEDMRVVAQESLRVLKPGGICAILIGDTRKEKRVIPIGFRTIEAFINQGFKLKDLIIKRQHNCRTDGFWYSSSIKYNFLLLAQEYLPVFLKPNADSAIAAVGSTESQSLASREVVIPAPPGNLECRTTWVFPSESFEELVEANVMNRYGKESPVLEVELGEQRDASLLGARRGYDLVYCKTWLGRDGNIHGLNDYVQSATFLVDAASHVINPKGHLVIRGKDVKVGDETISPALQIWSIPGESFRLREIIVLARQPADKMANQKQDSEITHEFLLVYQKEDEAKL
jgi:SAM-dependent methyltransferase